MEVVEDCRGSRSVFDVACWDDGYGVLGEKLSKCLATLVILDCCNTRRYWFLISMKTASVVADRTFSRPEQMWVCLMQWLAERQLLGLHRGVRAHLPSRHVSNPGVTCP